MKKMYRHKARLTASIWLLCSGISVAAELDLSNASALLNAGKAKESYELLATHEYEMAGNVDYDYLLGVAALDSGNPDKATLALERVLAVKPDHAGARLDLARAYFALGDIERAKTEFETVQSQNPPPVAQKVIAHYLSEIDKKQNPGITTSGYLEGTLGYDTNVNTANANNQIFIPLFNTSLTMDSASVAAKDYYFSVGGGMEMTKPVKSGLSLFAGVDAKRRQNFYKDTFNTDSLDFRAGLNIGEGTNIFRVSALKNLYDIDDRLNHRLHSLSGEWRHTYNARNIISVFGQYGRMRYGHDKTETDLSQNDVDQTVVGVGWMHAFDDYGKHSVFASFFSGNENTATSGTPRDDGDLEFHGIMLGMQKVLHDDLDVMGSIGFKKGRYQDPNFYLNEDFRKDYQHDLALSLNWRPSQSWIVKPQLSATRNNSNSALNAYNRIDVSITVRREFK